jgi:hypothetical protein
VLSDAAGVTPATLLETEEKPLERNEPTGGLHLSEGEKKTKGYRFGFFSGLRAVAGWAGSGSRARPSFGCWLSLLIFFCAASFLIFCFLFLSQILHIESKSSQTTF